LYGDLKGIIGQSLPAIEHLTPEELPLAASDGQPAARRLEKTAKAPLF
jgi:hypothetical protein